MSKHEFLSEKEVCTLLNISRTTLYRLREDDGLPYHKIGKRMIRYCVEELDAWLNIKPMDGEDAQNELHTC